MKKLALALLTLPILSGCATAAITGVTAAGVTHSQERSVGGAWDDVGIDTMINHKFLQSDVNDLFVNVGVTVWEGRVMLTGNVESHENAVRAVEMAWQVEGVKEVINELIINPDSTTWNRTKDEWVEKQIEARMLITKDLKSINYTSEVVAGVVYLIGTAQDQAELNRALAVARTTKGVQKVISHVIMKDDPRRTPLNREKAPVEDTYPSSDDEIIGAE